jgi:hypothetical protein
MSEMAENEADRGENVEKTAEVIRSRMEMLQNQRQELADRLEQEMALALAPLDSSIKELRWMLSQLTGQDVPPPQYTLRRRSAASQPPQPTQLPQNVHQFQPARQNTPSEDLPPPAAIVESPKSKTPVPTNEGILRNALQRKR